jgi:hypothetical protein
MTGASLRLRAAVLFVALSTARCAAPVAKVAWRVCPVTRSAEGHDIDDGGVNVGFDVDLRGLRRVALGHFPGSCLSEPARPATLVCSDPHVDVRYELRWVRLASGRLVVEQRELPVPTDDAPQAPPEPSSARVRASFELGGARVLETAPHCAEP